MLVQGRLLDLAVAYRLLTSEALRELGSGSELSEALKREALHDPERVAFEPPIPNPGKILCVAVNYWSHARETGTEPPESPYFFVKLPSTLVGHGATVVFPRGTQRADYEVELAVVIGRRGKYVSRASAMDYVFGYTVLNDLTVRERQAPLPRSPRLGLRWLHGKNFDTSTPLGPFVVTRDEIPDPHNLRLGTRVSGEVRQDGSTSDMVFKIPELIEAASDGLTLEPGDVIATGTPAGVGLGTGRYLKPGDVVEAWVEGVGVLVNYVAFET